MNASVETRHHGDASIPIEPGPPRDDHLVRRERFPLVMRLAQVEGAAMLDVHCGNHWRTDCQCGTKEALDGSGESGDLGGIKRQGLNRSPRRI